MRPDFLALKITFIRGGHPEQVNQQVSSPCWEKDLSSPFLAKGTKVTITRFSQPNSPGNKITDDDIAAGEQIEIRCRIFLHFQYALKSTISY